MSDCSADSFAFLKILYAFIIVFRNIYVETASPMIESTISGFNATIFAYGQTSSGE